MTMWCSIRMQLYAPKIQNMRQKCPVWVFGLDLIIGYRPSLAIITQATICMIANLILILYNCSRIKWIMCFRHSFVCFCSILPTKRVTNKATAELLCRTEIHTVVFYYWMNPRWYSDPFIETCLVSKGINHLNLSAGRMTRRRFEFNI